MRYLGAVRGTARIASEDIEYRDVLFPTGTLVMTSLAAANLDRRRVARPPPLRHHARAVGRRRR